MSKINPFEQHDYLGEVWPYNLMLMVDKNGRSIRLTRKTKELGIEAALQMTDSNSSTKGDQYSFFVVTSYEWRIPDELLKSLFWSETDRELGIARWQKVEWLEREAELTKEIWMPLLPNWLNAIKIMMKATDLAWEAGLAEAEVMKEKARKE